MPASHELAAARAQTLAYRQDKKRSPRRGIDAAEAEALWEGIEGAVERTVELTRCPRCGTRAGQPDRVFQEREDGSFRCSCTVCDAAWEGRLCRSCGRTYPVMDVSTGNACVLDGDQIDRQFGVDLLAVPCATRDRVFVCPWCVTCGNAQPNVDCARCVPEVEETVAR